MGVGRDLSSFPHSELMQPTTHEPWVLESEEKLWGRTQPRCVLFSWNSSFQFAFGLTAPFHTSSALDLKCMSMYFQSVLSPFYQKYYSCYLGCAIDQNEYLPSFLISSHPVPLFFSLPFFPSLPPPLACSQCFSKTSIILDKGGIKNKGLRCRWWDLLSLRPVWFFVSFYLLDHVNNTVAPHSKLRCCIHYYIFCELGNYHKLKYTNFPSGYL